MNTNPEKEVAENEEEDDDKGDYNPEEEIFKQQGAPTLPPRLVNTGEENDEEITKFRAKIYRWHDKQWKVSIQFISLLGKGRRRPQIPPQQGHLKNQAHYALR